MAAANNQRERFMAVPPVREGPTIPTGNVGRSLSCPKKRAQNEDPPCRQTGAGVAAVLRGGAFGIKGEAMNIFDRALETIGLAHRPPVEAGQTAPDFTLSDSEGRAVTLAELVAKGPAILAFFPRAFTAGCTRELRAFRDHHGEALERGARVVGISVDDVPTLARFKQSLGAPYTFLSDPDGKVARLYAGVSAGTANRVTVTVGPDRRVRRVTAGLGALFPAGDIQACDAPL